MEIQCTKVQDMSNLDNVYILGSPFAYAHNRLNMFFKKEVFSSRGTALTWRPNIYDTFSVIRNLKV